MEKMKVFVSSLDQNAATSETPGVTGGNSHAKAVAGRVIFTLWEFVLCQRSPDTSW